MSLDCYEYYQWTLGDIEVSKKIGEEILTILMGVDDEC